MRSILLAVLVPTLLVVLAPGPAAAAEGAEELPATQSVATGTNCLGEPRPKLKMEQVLGAKWGPWGIEHQLRVGGCTPAVKKPGILFDGSFVEGGFQMHTSPIYVMPGAYLTVAPLSILQFHLQAAPIVYWPIPLDGAGYYPLASYRSDYSAELLPGGEGATALGWYMRTGATLQLAVPIGPLRIIAVDSALIEFWELGTESFYFHNRNDLPAARQEWFLDNTALVLVGIPVHPKAELRIGVTDQLVMNFGAGQKSNILAGVVMLNLERPSRTIRDLMPILRLGVRTHHPVRQGEFSFTLAVTFKLDLRPGPKAS